MPVFSVVQEPAALGCEVDWGSLESAATAAAAGRMALMGNINNPQLLLSATPEVISACREAIAAGIQILAHGCAAPPRTLTANLQVLGKIASYTATAED
jgi:uroporphyrinogen-III decarboxylase